MDEHTANSVYATPEFNDLLKEKSNTTCFDCGNFPASWASVNNSIYLCINCAGNHRSFGVSVSYIRSILIDTWNETQIDFMKIGGNKRLEELLFLFEIPKSTSPDVLYFSKLLEFHRAQLKSDINKGKQLIPPKIEEALLPSEILTSNTGNKIYSVSSSSNDMEGGTKSSSSSGYFSKLGSMLNTAKEKARNVASNVKEKVNDMDIKNKIVGAGSVAVEKIKETGYLVKDKGAQTVTVLKDKGYEVGTLVKEKGTELAHSQTVQNIKSKVGNSVNYLYGKFWGSSNTNQVNNNESQDKPSNPNDIIFEEYDLNENKINNKTIDNKYTNSIDNNK